MYSENIVLGPLTSRQIIILAVGGGVAYIVSRLNVTYELQFLFMVIAITAVLVYQFRPRLIENPDQFYRQNPKNREKLLAKISEVESMIQTRQSRGVLNDPKLSEALTNLRRLQEEIDK